MSEVAFLSVVLFGLYFWAGTWFSVAARYTDKFEFGPDCIFVGVFWPLMGPIVAVALLEQKRDKK